MYSQPYSPRPSTTAVAPELRTANRSPASPRRTTAAGGAEQREVADQDIAADPGRAAAGEPTITVPPDIDLPTPSLQVPVTIRIPSVQNAAYDNPADPVLGTVTVSASR